MPLADVVRVRPSSAGAPSSSVANAANVVTTLYTGDYSTWRALGAPAPYAPPPLAATVAHNAHIQLFVFVRSAADLPLSDDAKASVVGVAGLALAPLEQARLREAALPHRAGVLIFVRQSAECNRLVLDAATLQRWPPPSTAPSTDVCCPPGYDSMPKIDAVRHAYPALQAQAVPPSVPTPPTQRPRIAAEEVRADEIAWRRQLAAATKPKESTSNFFLNMLAD